MKKKSLIIIGALCVLMSLGVFWASYSQRPGAAATPVYGPNLPAQSLRFLVVGDTGSGTKHQKDVAGAMARYAAQHSSSDPVQCVVMLGDNFYENGVKSTDDPQWDKKFEKIYDKTQLPMPFFAVLGNHDWRYDPVAQIQYAKDKPGTRWIMDGFWYKRQYFTAANGDKPLAEIFFIDTDLWIHKLDKLADKQMDWLADELKSSKARWKFVAGHHPLYSNGEHGADSDTQNVRDLLSPLLRKWRVDVYFSGHDHDLQRIEVPGHPTLFIISGAGGQLRPRKFKNWKPFYASSAGFAAFEVSEKEMKGQFLDAGGKVLDEWKRVRR